MKLRMKSPNLKRTGSICRTIYYNYAQSQSTRDNLIFTNIEESMHEKTEDCEGVLRHFMVQKLKLAQDVVDKLKIPACA